MCNYNPGLSANDDRRSGRHSETYLEFFRLSRDSGENHKSVAVGFAGVAGAAQ